MTYSYVRPAERFSLSLARRWLITYPLAQTLCVAVAAAAGFLAARLEWVDASHLTFATTVAVAAAYGLTFGYLRGRLLQVKLARLSLPMWCGGVALLSLYFVPPGPDALPVLPSRLSDLQTFAVSAAPVALPGFLYGLAIGTVEAIVLRRVALNVVAFVLWSGLAWGTGHIAASAALAYGASLDIAFVPAEVLHAAGLILQAAIAGLVTLPALGMLTERLGYYGPRVYRTTFRSQINPEPASSPAAPAQSL